MATYQKDFERNVRRATLPGERGEFQVGITRSDIEFILGADNSVLSFERVEGPTALWRIVYSSEGRSSAEMFVENGTNSIYIHIFKPIDSNHIVEALQATTPLVSGVAFFGEILVMRGGFFAEHATMHTMTNTLTAVFMAYHNYENEVGVVQ